MHIQSRYTITIALVILTYAGCNDSQELVSVRDWKTWAESTSDGLWEDNELHRVEFEQIAVFGAEDSSITVMLPLAACIYDGTVFITDNADQSVNCFTLDGELIWESGSPGEGPGHFSRIGNIDVNSEYVAVCNRGGGRVDLLRRSDGDWVSSIDALWPYDVALKGDTLYIANMEGDNLISAYEISTGNWLSCFAGDFWTPGSVGSLSPQGNANLCIDQFEENILLSSYFQNSAVLYDLSQSTLEQRIERTIPVDIANAHTGASGVVFSVYYVDCAIHEGIIHIMHGGYSTTGTKSSNAPNSTYTVVDRYNLNGEYLDSYVIPEAVATLSLEDNIAVVVDPYGACKVYVYQVTNI